MKKGEDMNEIMDISGSHQGIHPVKKDRLELRVSHPDAHAYESGRRKQMKKTMTAILVLWAVLFFPAAGWCEKTITMVADQWPPFNLDAAGNDKGYMIDIASEVFRARGIRVVYENIPWNRALLETEQGTFNAVVGASKTDARGFIFPEEEMARNTMAFYTAADSTWQFKDLSSLASVSLGVVDGYDYRDWLNSYIKENRKNQGRIQVMTGDDPLARNIKKLVYKRVDVIVGNNVAIPYAANKSGFSENIKPVWLGSEKALIYIAFSPSLDSSPEYAKMLSRGIKELRRSGKLEKIMERYGLHDWK